MSFLTLKIALRNVFRHRARSLLSLGTIAVGAGGLFLFGGFNTGMLKQYRQSTIHSRYGHGALFPKDYRGIAHAEPWKLWIDAEKVLPALKAMPEIKGVFPRVSLMAFATKDTTLIAAGEGITGAEAGFFNQLNYEKGGDVGNSGDAIVLGRGLAAGLDAKLGDEIDLSIKNQHSEVSMETVKVGGIFFTGVPAFDDTGFRIPLPLAQKALGTDRVESIFVELTNDLGWKAFAEKAKTTFPDLDAVSFEELDKQFYPNAVAWLNAQYTFIRSIVLLVVFLGIFNIISLGVTERTGEIGALRANGESIAQVESGLLLEAAFIGVLGGLLGLMLGWLMAHAVFARGLAMPPAPGFTRGFRIYIDLTTKAGLETMALCIVTTIIGAIVPVWRATRIEIAEALRT